MELRFKLVSKLDESIRKQTGNFPSKVKGIRYVGYNCYVPRYVKSNNNNGYSPDTEYISSYTEYFWYYFKNHAPYWRHLGNITVDDFETHVRPILDKKNRKKNEVKDI